MVVNKWVVICALVGLVFAGFGIAKLVSHPSHTVKVEHVKVTVPAKPAPKTQTPSQVPTQTPAPQPPPSQTLGACLSDGTCNMSQQQQIASALGITGTMGTNTCLSVGDCSPSQQIGIAQVYGIGPTWSPAGP